MLLMLTLKPPFPLVFTIQKTMNINKLFWWSTTLKGVADVNDKSLRQSGFYKLEIQANADTTQAVIFFYVDIFHLVHKFLNTSVHSPSNHDAETKPWKENTKISVSSRQHQKLYSHLKAIPGNSNPWFWHEPVEKWLILGTKQEFFFHCTSLKGMGC